MGLLLFQEMSAGDAAQCSEEACLDDFGAGAVWHGEAVCIVIVALLELVLAEADGRCEVIKLLMEQRLLLW